MKNTRLIRFIGFLGIFIILAEILISNAMLNNFREINGDYSTLKTVVDVKNNIDKDNEAGFNKQELWQLKNIFKNVNLTYSARPSEKNTVVYHDKKPYKAAVIATDSSYQIFREMNIKHGNFFQTSDELSSKPVAVIDNELAWEIFQTDNVVGMDIEMLDRTFIIIGICSEEKSLIRKLVDDGIPKIYIPFETLLDIEPNTKITNLQIKSEDNNTLDKNREIVTRSLEAINKEPTNYNITDYNIKWASVKQIPLIVTFLLGLIVILMGLRFIFREVKDFIYIIEKECQVNYILDVLKLNKIQIYVLMLKVTCTLILLCLVWKGVSFQPYVSPKYMSVNLFDLSYIKDLFKSQLEIVNSNAGYVAPYMEREFNIITKIVYFQFSISFFVGLPCLLISLNALKWCSSDLFEDIVNFTLLFILSLLILLLISYLLGLSVYGDYIRSVAGVWFFTFINIIKFKRKECGILV